MQGVPKPGAVLLENRLIEPKFSPHQFNPVSYTHLFLAGGSQFSPQKLDVRAHSLIHIKIAVTSPDTGIALFPCKYLSGEMCIRDR